MARVMYGMQSMTSHTIRMSLASRPVGSSREIDCSVDQRNMRERLWEIADKAFFDRIVFLRQQTNVIAKVK